MVDLTEFELVFQPKVSLETRRVVGCEALIRQRTQAGLRLPAAFIEHAESTGDIVPIGEWVFDEAARHAKQWRAAGHDITVAVNVSGRQAEARDLAGMVWSVLRHYDLPVGALELEVTESWRFSERNIETLYALQALGVSLSLDDFGTGYSSHLSLCRLPVSAIKLDKEFVWAGNTGHGRIILGNMMDLARALNLSVVAEGVENEAQATLMSSLGAVAAQGFLFARPESGDVFTQRLAAQAALAA